MRALVIILLVAGTAAAEPAPPRPFRLSIGGGGSFLVTGQGELPRNRLDGHLAVMPGGRFGRWGVVGAARHVTYDPVLDDGLFTIGAHYEAAASRPRLALALHADVGVSYPAYAPVVGGGVETHLWLVPKYVPPLALVFDTTAHLVVDGVEDTRLVLAGAARLAIAF